MSQSFPFEIRDGRDSDSEALISLIGRVFDEYPGCVLDLDGEMPHMRAVATAFRDWGGKVWVAERDGRVIGCIACTPAKHDDRCLELRMLYVDKDSRRAGVASRLCDVVEAEARASGAEVVELWSDTRFKDAHRLYEGRGYVGGTVTRELHDKSDTVEFCYRMRLGPDG